MRLKDSSAGIEPVVENDDVLLLASLVKYHENDYSIDCEGLVDVFMG